jgi:hypothetical protein
MQDETGIENRIFHARGRNSYESGVDLGSQIGVRLAAYIQEYFEARLASQDQPDLNQFRNAAMDYLHRLPERFRAELEGISVGARLPLARLAEWVYLEPYLESGCTGLVCLIDGQAWVARNNDIFAPHLWGYATIREIENRNPHITFGLMGDVFTPTGVNRERLWLHYNYLPAWDKPSPGKPVLAPYAFLVEALETCSTLQDLEKLLVQIDRDGGMLLYAVNGKNGDFALYECTCQTQVKREPVAPWLVGANHFCAMKDTKQDKTSVSRSVSRQNRMEDLLRKFYDLKGEIQLPESLISILADDRIEGRGPNYGTVYANVACPSTGDVWYTFGGYPAASQGNWARLNWPW